MTSLITMGCGYISRELMEDSGSNVKLDPSVHWAQIDNVVFVLDARRGEYLGLDRKTSDLWLQFTNTPGSIPSLADPLELQNLSVAMRNKGWLDEGFRDSSPLSRKPPRLRFRRTPSQIIAAACLLRAFTCLKYSGFASAYQWAKSYLQTSVVPAASQPPRFKQAMKTFQIVEHMFVSSLGLKDCLPRSLALFVFLRRYGIPARHLIGIRLYPFVAHAWVEYEDVPLLQSVVFGKTPRSAPARDVGDFTPIATIG